MNTEFNNFALTDFKRRQCHTFIVVENKKVGKVKFAYGSEWDGVKGVFSGKLIKRD